MADAILYDGYLSSLILTVKEGYEWVSDCGQVIENEKSEILSLNDELLKYLERQIKAADALMERAERSLHVAEAKAYEARSAIRPLPPEPVPPTEEQQKKDPACMKAYMAQCQEFESIKQTNAQNQARAEAMEQSSASIQEYAGLIQAKRDELLDILAQVQADKENFPTDLSYLTETKERQESFITAMARASEAADMVLSCTCDRMYNSFPKFDVPLPYDTGRLSSRFRIGGRSSHSSGSLSSPPFSDPTPMPNFRNYPKKTAVSSPKDGEGKGEDDRTVVTVEAGTLTSFFKALEAYPQARTVYTTQYYLKSCGKKALIRRMEAMGFTFIEDSEQPKFIKE